MQKYFDNVTNRGGAAVPSASVLVKTLAGAVATIYSDNGSTVAANPITCDGNGYFSFYAADGRYSITVSGKGITTQTFTDILLEDPVDDEIYAIGGAARIGFTAAGGIAAENVQAALEELDAEKASAANLAAPSGSSEVGFIQAGAGAVARTGQAELRERFSLKQFGAVGDDATNNAAGFQAAATAAFGDALLVPKGTFRIGSVINLPAGGITIEGKGYDSVLKVGANNQVLLQLISGGWLRLYNIRLVGDGTASSSSNGIGLLTSDTGDIDLDTVWFEGFGAFGWRNIDILGSTRTRIRGRNITVTGGKDALGGETADISLRGKFGDVFLENLFLEAAAITAVSNGVFISQDVAGENWEGASIRGLVCRGHGKRGLVLNSEVAAGNFESGKASVVDAKFYDITASAIKTKNVDRLMLANIYAESCDSTPEIAGNLQGSIFINGAEDFTGTNIIVKDAGTDGIRFNGRAAGDATGVGRSKLILSNYICNTANESGIYVGPNVQSLTINAPQIYDAAQTGGAGVSVVTTTALAPPTDIAINSPRIRRTAGHRAGIAITGLAGQQVGTVHITDPRISECGGFGISSSYADYLQINGGNVIDNGQGGVNVRGVDISNTTTFQINATRSTNVAGATQAHGLRLAGGIANANVHNCDLSGNATGAVSYTAPTTIRASGNQGWLEGSKTYDPASLAAGATQQTTVTVTDAAVGDKVDVAFSLAAGGIVWIGTVTSASTVTVTMWNVSAGAIDLASGTLTARVRK